MLREGPAATPDVLAGAWLDCVVGPCFSPAAPSQVDQVIEEVPVALVYNGISHAVMLASPCDLEDFAVGFSLAEALVQSTSEIYGIDVLARCEGIEIQIDIASRRMAGLKERRRSAMGRSGCGLCGVQTLTQATHPICPVHPGGRVKAEALASAFAQLASQQAMYRNTGAAHAAGFADWNGNLHVLREDVGRHNALDKLAGALARRCIDPSGGFALVTSRASYEMVQKTACAGIGLLAALSAPTALAVRCAEASGVTLVGFAGRSRRLVYAHPQRVS